jgi:hypothetical protein
MPTYMEVIYTNLNNRRFDWYSPVRSEKSLHIIRNRDSSSYVLACSFLSNHPTAATTASHIATDGQLISKSLCRAPSGTYGHIFITLWQLRSLTRRRVCLFQILLALASVVFLGSQSVWTRDHILLSQIWDFTFRHLLRFAGSRSDLPQVLLLVTYPLHGPHRKQLFQEFFHCGMTSILVETAYKSPLPTVTPLLRVTQPLPSNCYLSSFTVLALRKYVIIYT